VVGRGVAGDIFGRYRQRLRHVAVFTTGSSLAARQRREDQ
jgi:hypothetical protein